LALMRLIDEQIMETPSYGSRQMMRHLRRLGHLHRPQAGGAVDAPDGATAVDRKPWTSMRKGLPQSWGSCGDGHCRVRIVGWPGSLSEVRTEGAIIDSATNLKEQVGAASRPPHLLTFVHPAVHQEVGRPFGDRGPYSQPGSVPLGVIDQPVALANQIAIQRMQGDPQLS
jgi:hypothetical protein